jgi:hypothetical protein
MEISKATFVEAGPNMLVITRLQRRGTTIDIRIGVRLELASLKNTDSILEVEWNPEQEAALRDIEGTGAKNKKLRKEILILNSHVACRMSHVACRMS